MSEMKPHEVARLDQLEAIVRDSLSLFIAGANALRDMRESMSEAEYTDYCITNLGMTTKDANELLAMAADICGEDK